MIGTKALASKMKAEGSGIGFERDDLKTKNLWKERWVRQHRISVFFEEEKELFHHQKKKKKEREKNGNREKHYPKHTPSSVP